LGTFGGSTGDAYKINDANQIVGDAGFADSTFHAALWQQGAISDLGTLGDDPCSGALDINSRGQIVGRSGDCDYSAISHAFLWDKTGPMVDLNTLISSASGIYVFFASNINDRGEIAAAGLLPNGDVHAVLLVPCDENHPDVDGCDHSMVETGSATSVRPTVRPNPGVAPLPLRSRRNN
jgi:probable HAF family extracellular repeat protein